MHRITVIGTLNDWFIYGFNVAEKPANKAELRKAVEQELAQNQYYAGRKWAKAYTTNLS